MQVSARVALHPGLPESFSTVDDAELRTLRDYFGVLSKENYLNGLRRLAGLDHEPCHAVSTTGIFHPGSDRFFESADEYASWLRQTERWSENAPVAGIIMHYNLLAEANHADVDALIKALSESGIVPFCVFFDSEAAMMQENRYPWHRLFTSGELRPDVVLNFLLGRLIATPEERHILQDLDVPVIQLIRNFMLSPDEWLADPVGISAMTLTHSLVQPEMFGAIDPVMVSGTHRNPGDPMMVRTSVPIPERIAMLTRRVRRWAHLRRAPNAEKRVAIMLHNNPCKGVESTIGMAAGLDTFESLLGLLRRMRDEGYDTGELPESGKALLELIQDRKALLEFRWTTADEIMRKGGVLHAMHEEEYRAWFDRLDAGVRKRVDGDWGAFPGEGMALEVDGKPALLITGLRFGKVLVMPQPKRGCYGTRCDGEVCRILHDPDITPPHHWLATYFWIQQQSDAVIHFGTSGALEYLPGKRAVLSGNCFSDISLGDLPNIYPYIMDVPGEGMTAKRRGRAVIIDHLTPVYRLAALTPELQRFDELLNEYRRAVDGNENARIAALQDDLLELAVSLRFLPEDATAAHLLDEAESLSRRIGLVKQSMVPDGMHRFGQPPSVEGVASMLTAALPRLGDEYPSVAEVAGLHPGFGGDDFRKAVELFAILLDPSQGEQAIRTAAKTLPETLKVWCLKTAEGIGRAGDEQTSVIRALSGRYIDAGLGDAPSSAKLDVLPSGRNFYAADIMTMPTEAAWSIGSGMANMVLQKFHREEGRFPESIGMSLWSSDAFKSDGELLSQIFALMGVRPVRQSTGRVNGIEVIPIDELKVSIDGVSIPRPRIDVAIETSSIVRDMVPHFLALIDKAVAAVSALDESPESNFVRKHTLEQLDALRESHAEQMEASLMQRLSLYRVFSAPPGTYANGVALALDASAWNDRRDLAETYINHSGYAYGGEQLDQGVKACEVFSRQLANIEVSYIKQTSEEYDALDCGCYASSAGGMAAAAQALSGKPAKTWWADATRLGNPDIRDFREEAERAVRAKLCNESWIESMKEHGFQGAQGFASRINNLFKWSATTGEIETWVFERVVETFVQNDENREWIRKQNPWALEEITRRLLEAEARGLWDAKPELLDAVKQAALSIEGDLEESIGDVEESFQGGSIDVFTGDDVERWKREWRIIKE
ncbi:MAG TPA: cobaltochelatase subunit CobN [Chlorobaculum parvum]|uniref:Cobaltochelatase subunit CobN n=1 Tax=Chlorobaculum parvum TaxID=274539 RepID=A0A7C5HIK6_9CHLB|nr:cobaltochelatase subunit CobN [Chlorobaculum parvum]